MMIFVITAICNVMIALGLAFLYLFVFPLLPIVG
jgi:hypothetical protein